MYRKMLVKLNRIQFNKVLAHFGLLHECTRTNVLSYFIIGVELR
jgi:hypothetical protein